MAGRVGPLGPPAGGHRSAMSLPKSVGVQSGEIKCIKCITGSATFFAASVYNSNASALNAKGDYTLYTYNITSGGGGAATEEVQSGLSEKFKVHRTEFGKPKHGQDSGLSVIISNYH